MALPGRKDEVVAIVAGKAITLDEIEARLWAMKRGPMSAWLPGSGPEDRRSRRWVLQLLVTEAIIRRYSPSIAGSSPPRSGGPLANGIDPQEAERLASGARRLFDSVTSGVHVAEDKIHAYYVRNLDRYRTPERRRLRHLIEGSRLHAEEAAVRLRVTADPVELGVRLDLTRGEFSGSFEEEVFAAQVGDLIGPVESELGWHVAVLEEVIPATVLSYVDVQAEIEADLQAVARGRVFGQWLDERRRDLCVMMPGWGHPGDPSLPDFTHRH